MTLPAAADGASCYSFAVNHWFCTSYWRDYASDIEDATVQHVWITVASVAIGLAISLPLALLARRFFRLQGVVLGGATALYTIPSLAMFSLLLPLTHLTPGTVIVGLVLYSLTILIRNTLAGLRAVPADVRESAVGLGYSATRMLFKVELPLALPVILAGLRVATVSTVALTTVGAIVGYGGLGNLLYDGVNTQFKSEIFAASVLCVALAVVLDLLILGAQRALTPWVRAGR